ncbi:hypothetical protein IKN40_04020 [bacterium]|nr:hypothetical protein [bacterium]
MVHHQEVEVDEVEDEDEVIVEMDIKMELNIVIGEIVKKLSIKVILYLKIQMFRVLMNDLGFVLNHVH